MDPWTDRLDSLGQPHHSDHKDGHKVALFPDGWWAYHRDYRYTPPGYPRLGPEPAGPFSTLRDAKKFVVSQGWVCPFPFAYVPQSPIEVYPC